MMGMGSSAKRQRQAWTAERLRVQAGVPLDWSPLDGLPMPDYVPDFWTGPHVGLRLVEAFKCLANLSMRGGGGSGGCWPHYCHDWADLLAQNESDDSEKDQRIRQQNRARIAPSAQEISRMETAISWAGRYLPQGDARLVQQVAFMRSQDREFEHIAMRLRRSPRELRETNRIGLDRIAAGLRLDDEPVF